MSPYLKTTIEETKRTEIPRYGIDASGYTLRSGAPTSIMLRLQDEKRWRRLMCWQFSNAGTCFVRILRVNYIVRDCDLP